VCVRDKKLSSNVYGKNDDEQPGDGVAGLDQLSSGADLPMSEPLVMKHLPPDSDSNLHAGTCISVEHWAF